MLKKIIVFLSLCLCLVDQSNAQFIQGQVLTAAGLNAALAHPTIIGGTITGLSSPIPVGSGGTGATTATGATSQLQYLQGTTGSVARSVTSKLQERITPEDFGATGNGAADDTTAVQNAINATPAHGVLYLPNLYAISAALTTPNPITIVGANGGQGEYSNTCTNGLMTTTANINVFPSLQAGSVVKDLCIGTTLTGNSAGIALGTVAAGNSVVMEHNQINGQCYSVWVSGNGITQTKNALVIENTIRPSNNAACNAITVGKNSTGGNTGDGVYRDNVIYCGNAATGFYFYDTGGDSISNNNEFACSYGTVIKPGANQEAIFTYFIGGVIGDYSTNNDLLIDTASPQAGIASLFFTNTWTSGDGNTPSGPEILIQNTGGASNFQGIHFVGHRSYNYTPGNDNVKISGNNIKFVEFLDSHICSAVAGTGSAAGIHILAGPSNTSIKNNVVGSCDVSGSFPNGVLVDSGANSFTITGNDISSGTTAWAVLLSGTSASTTALVKDNLGIDNNIATLASAATIGLLTNTLYSITGTTAVTTINGMYSGRMVYLTTPSGVSFNTGGNICNAVTSAAGNTVIGYWTGSCWQLK